MQHPRAPLNLKKTFVVLDQGLAATPVAVTDSFWADLSEKFGDFEGNTLLASFDFTEDWPTWEVHPNGDEIVCLVSGNAEMIMDFAQGEQSVRLQHPGSYVIVPKGTWHTARIHAPTSMIFITPGEATENRETPPQRVR